MHAGTGAPPSSSDGIWPEGQPDCTSKQLNTCVDRCSIRAPCRHYQLTIPSHSRVTRRLWSRMCTTPACNARLISTLQRLTGNHDSAIQTMDAKWFDLVVYDTRQPAAESLMSDKVTRQALSCHLQPLNTIIQIPTTCAQLLSTAAQSCPPVLSLGHSVHCHHSTA